MKIIKSSNLMPLKAAYITLYVLWASAFSGCHISREKQIETAIMQQLKSYPESRLQDIYKNFYQDCFGTGHAISDTNMVQNWLAEELENLPPASVSTLPLIESIGWRHHFVRVNIDIVKQGKMSADQLCAAFIESASLPQEKDMQQWTKEWHKIVSIIEKRAFPVKDFENDKILIDSILQENPRAAMHHSRAFNEHYAPHYRVVATSVLNRMIQ